MNKLLFIISNIITFPYILFIGCDPNINFCFLPKRLDDILYPIYNLKFGQNDLSILFIQLLIIYNIIFSFQLYKKVKVKGNYKYKDIIFWGCFCYLTLHSFIIILVLLTFLFSHSMDNVNF